jgi:hypothetical protein
LLEVPAFPFADLRFIQARLAANDEDLQFLEVGEYGEGQVLVLGVAFALKGVTRMEFFGGFLGFANKTFAALGAEKIIGAFLASLNLSSAFDLDFPFRLNQPGPIFHVPAQRAEEGIEKIFAEFGFDVVRAFEFGQVPLEAGDETVQFLFESCERGFESCERGVG